MRKIATMREALSDPDLLEHALQGDSWASWRILLIAAVGEELTEAERETWRSLTGRDAEPGVLVEIFEASVGRRGVMLKDTPGGPELIQSLIGAIETLALLYSNTPDERAREHLQSYITRIEPGIIEAVGAGTAAKMLEVFARAVMGEKHRLEAMSRGRA